MEVIGKQMVAGEFKGMKYRHLKLHCISPLNEHGEGHKTDVVKIKKGCDSWYEQISIGDEIVVYYDRFGNAVDLSIQC